MLYENDIPDTYGDWAQIERFVDSNTSDDEVWEVARQSEEIPHIGNIILQLTFSNIERWCEDNGHECTYFVNSLDSHLNVNGEEIYSLSNFKNALEVSEYLAA